MKISVTTHGLVELVAGLAMLGAAFALDLGTAGTVLTFAAGALVVGLGLGAAETLPLGVHQSLDHALVVALAAAAIGTAVAGSGLAALVLVLGAAVLLALSTATRWTRATVIH